MTETTFADQASSGFISYRRDDNRAFRGVVDQLRDDIANTFEARTGRNLSLFLDRDTIGWGEEWREKIRASVESATVFIPVVTMRYFTSQACRDELFAFHEVAKRLGVTQLILPIVLMGAENITREDERPEVRLIESLNYKSIEVQFRAGFDSPEWLSIIDEIVRDLITSLQAAEESLIAAGRSAENRLDSPSVASTGELGETGADDQEPPLGFTEFSGAFEEVTALTETATETMGQLGEVANEFFGGVDFESMPPKQMTILLLRSATAFAEPAKLLEQQGKELETRVTEIDASLRSLIRELRSIDNPQATGLLAELLSGFESVDDMGETNEQMESLIGTLQFASVMSPGLRKSLQPAIRGIRAFQTSARTFGSWRDLLD